MISVAREEDLPELLGLMRAYCDFYEVAPSDASLLAMSRALIANPEHDGLQLIARAQDGSIVGFATLVWTLSTLDAAREGVMNDLFVVPSARGQRIGEQLIAACLERCRERGAASLGWQTAHTNERAQRLYDRVGAKREEWVDYSLKADQEA